jgi:hypothetical protein
MALDLRLEALGFKCCCYEDSNIVAAGQDALGRRGDELDGAA